VTLSDQASIAGVRQIVDTQVISYAMKDRWPGDIEPQDVSHAVISSVTALELLEVRRPSASNRPRYYLYSPLVPELTGDDEAARGWDRVHKGRVSLSAKNRTDQVILDFGSDFPVVVEYGHLMVGWLLKRKRVDVYARRIAHLDKRERRRLIGTFSYLVENDLRCLSLDRITAQIGIDLLRQYAMLDGNNLKADFRNSLNDMLILATSINSGADLLTEDRALWRFAIRTLNLPLNTKGPLIELETSSKSAKSASSKESKGYINHPWEARVRNRAARPV
jgi:predicted nucleic acid-binding protein